MNKKGFIGSILGCLGIFCFRIIVWLLIFINLDFVIVFFENLIKVEDLILLM